MNTLRSFITTRPLVTYFVLAYVFSWTLIALIPVSIMFSLLALFGPTLAAIIVTRVLDGKAGVGTLLRRVIQWRIGVAWYAAAIGIPFLASIAARAVYSFTTGTPFGMAGEISVPLLLLLGILVLGEEIGWRGFALPYLQMRNSGLISSLILGSLWACWHLANGTIPGLEMYWTGFPAFLFFVMMQTIVFTWLFNHGHGSILLMWIMHASVNISGALFYVGNQVTQWWLTGAAFGIIVLILILKDGTELARKSPSQYQTIEKEPSLASQ